MGRLFAVLSTALLWLASTETASNVKGYNNVPALQNQGEDLNPPSFKPYASPPQDRLVDDAAYWHKDLLLFKLMKSLQQGDSSGDDSPYFKSEYDYMDWGWPEASDVKESDVKRSVTSLNNSASGKASKAPTVPYRRKWKIKSGNGFLSLCYFKLCAFRRNR